MTTSAASQRAWLRATRRGPSHRYVCSAAVARLNEIPGRVHLRSADNGRYHIPRAIVGRSQSFLSYWSRGLESAALKLLLKLFVKWTVSQPSSAILKLNCSWMRTSSQTLVFLKFCRVLSYVVLFNAAVQFCKRCYTSYT